MRRVRELRKQRGINQSDLAALLAVSQSTLSNWEKGVYEPELAKLCRLADVLEVSTDYLLERTDNPAPAAPGEDASLREPYLRLAKAARQAGWSDKALEKLTALLEDWP